jgi:hypothetical protein
VPVKLKLLVEKFAVIGTDGLETLLLHAEPGSPTVDALAALRTSIGSGG